MSKWSRYLVALLAFAAATSACAQETLAWINVPGRASEIAAGGNQVWVIGDNEQIYRWTGSALGNPWQRVEGSAVRIAVDANGNAWVVNSQGQIFRWTGAGFQNVPGEAQSISAGQHVWVIGKNRSIYRWTGGTDANAWQQVAGTAERVAVGNSVWVVNGQNQIFRLVGSSFQNVQGAATDIAANADRVYVVGVPSAAGALGAPLFRWNQTMGANPWNGRPGLATRVAVADNGEVWAINRDGQIYKGTPYTPAMAPNIEGGRCNGVLVCVPEKNARGGVICNCSGS